MTLRTFSKFSWAKVTCDDAKWQPCASLYWQLQPVNILSSC